MITTILTLRAPGMTMFRMPIMTWNIFVTSLLVISVFAHFHYVLFGTIVFAVFSGIYFWFPKMFGRMLDDRLGKVHFWLTFVGFHATFLVRHRLGTEGMPRRSADYLATAFDAKYPELAAGEQSIAGPPEGGAKPLTAESHGGARYREDADETAER